MNHHLLLHFDQSLELMDQYIRKLDILQIQIRNPMNFDLEHLEYKTDINHQGLEEILKLPKCMIQYWEQ